MKRENPEKLKKEYFEYTDGLLERALSRAVKKAAREENQEYAPVLAIWYFLQSNRIKRRNYLTREEQNILKEKFIHSARSRFAKKLPLSFYLFDLPIKTDSLDQAVDLGEEILVRNLDRIAQKIETLYPYGVQFTVLSDGDVFTLSQVIDHSVIDLYMANVTRLLKKHRCSHVSFIDWHTYIFKDRRDMLHQFTYFKTHEKYTAYLSEEIIRKAKKRFETFSNEHSSEKENDFLMARAFFEKTKTMYESETTAADANCLGFKLTKGGFKRKNPVLAIYPADPNIENSVSRGRTNLVRKESGIVVPILENLQRFYRENPAVYERVPWVASQSMKLLEKELLEEGEDSFISEFDILRVSSRTYGVFLYDKQIDAESILKKIKEFFSNNKYYDHNPHRAMECMKLFEANIKAWLSHQPNLSGETYITSGITSRMVFEIYLGIFSANLIRKFIRFPMRKI